MSTGVLAAVVALAVVAAGVAVMLLLVSRGRARGPEGPFVAGYAPELERQIEEESPPLIADPFGGARNFWVDLEGGELVALVDDVPGDPDCRVQWKEPRQGYVDCRGNVLDSEDLDRYSSSISTNPDNEGAFLVDVRRVIPAPSDAN